MYREATSSNILHLHEQDVRTSQGFQSPASIMIVVPTFHLGEERQCGQCDPDLSFLFNVSNTTMTTLESPGTRQPNHRPSNRSHRVTTVPSRFIRSVSRGSLNGECPRHVLVFDMRNVN